jgi:hypothetical protein
MPCLPNSERYSRDEELQGSIHLHCRVGIQHDSPINHQAVDYWDGRLCGAAGGLGLASSLNVLIRDCLQVADRAFE